MAVFGSHTPKTLKLSILTIFGHFGGQKVFYQNIFNGHGNSMETQLHAKIRKNIKRSSL